MNRDPWAGEQMSRSDAQRRYNNLVVYQLRPMLMNRSLNDIQKVVQLKRVVSNAHRFKYESGVVAGAGTREEVVDLLKPFLHPEHPAGEELKDWITRTMRAFGATVETDDY